MCHSPEMFIKILSHPKVNPRARQASSELSDSNAVVRRDASLEKFAACVLQIRKQQQISCLKQVLDIFWLKKNLCSIDVIQNPLKCLCTNIQTVQINTHLPIMLLLVFIVAEQCSEIQRRNLINTKRYFYIL